MPLKVAYLVKRFPRLSETFILGEILELRRQGLDVQVYALMNPGEAQVQPEAKLLLAEVTYLHKRERPIASWGRLLIGAAGQACRRPDGLLRVAWALASVHRSTPSLRHAVEALWLAGDLRRRRVAHLHAHFVHSPAAVAYFTFLAGGPPFSFTAHAKDLYTTLPRNLRIRARAARFAVTCTRFNASYLRDLLGATSKPIHVLYHGTDLRRFNAGGGPHKPGGILSVGRLVPKKGFSVLLEGLAHLERDGLGWRADIFGGGPLREDLQRLRDRLGIGAKVAFHGARLQKEIVAAYQQASVFVLAPLVTDDGDRDGIPNVLVEAMASGLAVVSTRISGIPELITDGVNGLLVDANDPEALAAAVERILRDPELARRLGHGARATVERFFDVRVNTRHLHNLFLEQILGVQASEAAA
jgi:glycosyltransferase involved in cell wall biosynthesis